MKKEEYVPIVPGIPHVSYEEEDGLEHNEYGFCDDMSHECHENQESITDLNQDVENGLASTGDADRIYRNQTF
jgi:hypothetical protein